MRLGKEYAGHCCFDCSQLTHLQGDTMLAPLGSRGQKLSGVLSFVRHADSLQVAIWVPSCHCLEGPHFANDGS